MNKRVNTTNKFEFFPCECEIHNKINKYREQGIEIHFFKDDPWCYLDPNPNNSSDPFFLKREEELINFKNENLKWLLVNERKNKPITKSEYTQILFQIGIYGRNAEKIIQQIISKKAKFFDEQQPSTSKQYTT